MISLKAKLRTSVAVLPLALVAAGAMVLTTTENAPAESHSTANACNPCAAAKACNPCNPCAAVKTCNPCAAKDPCAAANACNPCAATNPCAAANACNPINPCGACNPCAASNASATQCYVPRIKKEVACNPCAAAKYTSASTGGGCNPCNPCAAKACNPCAAAKACNPCNPCAAKDPCNPCAAAKACNPCNPCAAAKACNPCNPCAAKDPCNPCAAAKACNPCNPCAAAKACNPCNPCAAANACNPCNPCAASSPVADPEALALTREEANALYDCLKGEMKASYKTNAYWAGKNWQKFTDVTAEAYPSATHGGRYVVNLANYIAAKQYSKFADETVMPTGSVLAKPSFTISPSGQANLGPLFFMEKMTKGFSAETADWRYTAVMPGGSLMGMTGGQNSAGMKFCHDCHESAEDADYMFYLPEEFRK